MAATKQQKRSKTAKSDSTAKRPSTKTKRSNGSSNGSRSRASSPQTRARATRVVKDTKDAEPAKPIAAVKDGAGKVAKTVGRAAVGAAPVVTAVAGTAAGVVGGVLLTRSQQRSRTVLGMKLPRGGNDSLVRAVGEAGRQLGKLATEVHEARQKAERVGKALG